MNVTHDQAMKALNRLVSYCLARNCDDCIFCGCEDADGVCQLVRLDIRHIRGNYNFTRRIKK